MKKKTLYISYSAVIAALYVVLTLFSSIFGLDKGVFQLRISEALCILPCLTSAAIPGLTVGCLLSGIFCGSLPADILFGSIATLIGAVLGFLIGKINRFLTPIPNIISNTIAVPFILKYAYSISGGLSYFALTVFISELVCSGFLGIVLLHSIPNSIADAMKKSELYPYHTSK